MFCLFHCRESTYVLCVCYACAGSQVQMCAMRLGTPGAFRFRCPLSLVTLEDRLQIVWIAVQSYWIMKAQAEQLPSVLLPEGRTEVKLSARYRFLTVLYRSESPFPMRLGRTVVAS